MLEEYVEVIPIGDENDANLISKVLRENRYRVLGYVEHVRDYKIALTFYILPPRYINQRTFPTRVLQVSKRKHSNVYEHIRNVIEHEVFPVEAKKFVKHKTWHVLKIIELPARWLVFMV